MKNKQLNKDLSSMSRDESEQNIIELTTQVESQKQKIQWLQEQFDLLQQKRFGVSSEKNMTDGDQMSLFNEAEWTVDEADGQIPVRLLPPTASCGFTEAENGILRAGSSCMSIRITEGKRILRISLETSRGICRRTDIPDTIPSQSGRKIPLSA